MKMIIGVSGQAGSGKDTVADFLVKNHGFVKVALADPLKRACKEFYNFTEDQLWGPSENRNKPDQRYPREQHEFSDRSCKVCGFKAKERKELSPVPEWPQCYLTPRYALQLLGTEFGRHCYDNTWVDYTLRVAKVLLGEFEESYTEGYNAREGLHRIGNVSYQRPQGVVVSDVRFINEISAIKNVGGFVVRVNRSGAGLDGSASAHRSEAEMREISDDKFNYVIQNIGTLEELEKETNQMVESFKYEL